jgi:hypothetical protein
MKFNPTVRANLNEGLFDALLLTPNLFVNIFFAPQGTSETNLQVSRAHEKVLEAPNVPASFSLGETLVKSDCAREREREREREGEREREREREKERERESYEKLFVSNFSPALYFTSEIRPRQ